MVVLLSIVGVRYLLYFHSFFFHWPRYRRLERITTNDIKALTHVPFVKVQITTRGLPDSTEAITWGIRNVAALCEEDADFYGRKISVEVVTESSEQKDLLEHAFSRSPFDLKVVVVPAEYETPEGTGLKARALHYMVELRRLGFNRKPGRTFIVHYDEESVMEPGELRKLIHYLATTDKKLTEGPIFYPLNYGNASILGQAVEAHRPIGCFECRGVMEMGMPLHLHGSNLVIEEELENKLGWDVGTLDGQPFVAEDHVFGVRTYLKEGPEIFGWHGCVMLEQPPFSFKAARRQRRRWVMGVLQGMAMMRRMPEFRKLSKKSRFRFVWGIRFRILTFALGLPAGVFGLLYLLFLAERKLFGQASIPLPFPLALWLVLVAFMWLSSAIIGAWFNLSSARQMSAVQRWTGGALVLAVAPVSGILESSVAFWTVMKWLSGNREVSWLPTPKSKQADRVAHRESAE
jgi:cellulose synthase/poly-beta-1,6-N-acetylglucosamine synthase-like glycosyltransferase